MDEDTLMALGLLDRWLGIKLDDSLIPTLLDLYKDSKLPNSLLFKHITGLLERDGVEVVVVRDNTYGSAAGTVGNSKPMRLRLNPCRLIESVIPEGSKNWHEKLLRIVTHELIHEITSRVVFIKQEYADDPVFGFRDGEINYNRIINELYIYSLQYEAKAHPEDSWWGFQNIKEFVAEALSNPDFQKLLSKIPYTNKVESVLGELFNSIAAFLEETLGYKVEDNVLKGVLDASDEYFSFLGDHEIFVWNYVPQMYSRFNSFPAKLQPIP